MYILAMTTDYCYWEQDHKHHHARQTEKKALESHSWKQGKASISSTPMALQNKENPSLAASSTKNSSFKLHLSPAPKKQPNTLQMDLSSKLASNGKLTSNECKKCFENKLDFCQEADHSFS